MASFGRINSIWVILTLLASVCEAHFKLTDDGFVVAHKAQFYYNGSPFVFNGFNSYWMMNVASDPSERHKVTEVFNNASQLGLSVCRTWAFSDGGNYALQISPGVYNERLFQGLDFVISEAGKYGIKLILSLGNNYKDFGGREQYVKWARNAGAQINNVDDFYTNSVTKTCYKNHVKKVLTRVNTQTKKAYKDDSTIMAWELMNEPRCQSDKSGNTVHNWIQEMATYVKSIDNKHLLEGGMEGFYGESTSKKQSNPLHQVGTDFIKSNQIKEIDFATIHAYPDIWLSGEPLLSQLTFMHRWMWTHWSDSRTILNKPLLITEFGMTKKGAGAGLKARDQLFNAVYGNMYNLAERAGGGSGGMGGCLIWQVMAEGMDSFYDGYEVVLSRDTSTVSLIRESTQKFSALVHELPKPQGGFNEGGNGQLLQGSIRHKLSMVNKEGNELHDHRLQRSNGQIQDHRFKNPYNERHAQRVLNKGINGQLLQGSIHHKLSMANKGGNELHDHRVQRPNGQLHDHRLKNPYNERHAQRGLNEGRNGQLLQGSIHHKLSTVNKGGNELHDHRLQRPNGQIHDHRLKNPYNERYAQRGLNEGRNGQLFQGSIHHKLSIANKGGNELHDHRLQRPNGQIHDHRLKNPYNERHAQDGLNEKRNGQLLQGTIHHKLSMVNKEGNELYDHRLQRPNGQIHDHRFKNPSNERHAQDGLNEGRNSQLLQGTIHHKLIMVNKGGNELHDHHLQHPNGQIDDHRFKNRYNERRAQDGLNEGRNDQLLQGSIHRKLSMVNNEGNELHDHRLQRPNGQIHDHRFKNSYNERHAQDSLNEGSNGQLLQGSIHHKLSMVNKGGNELHDHRLQLPNGQIHDHRFKNPHDERHAQGGLNEGRSSQLLQGSIRHKLSMVNKEENKLHDHRLQRPNAQIHGRRFKNPFNERHAGGKKIWRP